MINREIQSRCSKGNVTFQQHESVVLILAACKNPLEIFSKIPMLGTRQAWAGAWTLAGFNSLTVDFTVQPEVRTAP